VAFTHLTTRYEESS